MNRSSINAQDDIMDEQTPLLQQRPEVEEFENGKDENSDHPNSRRNLSTFAGVFSPVALSMFSTVLFLRLGFVVGQAGILETIALFCLAYLILAFTILSVCAISTNGAVEGGGAYYMISRALGPEFGGSLGLLFFLANIFAAAMYISGFVEGVLDNFGPDGRTVEGALPSNAYWYPYLYESIVLLFCLLVCIVGGSMFARTCVFILFICVVCMLSVILSTFIVDPQCVSIPAGNVLVYPVPRPNGTNPNETHCGNYTGINGDTFINNLGAGYSEDYDTLKMMSFTTVFAILFSSVTGIMNGANMSGELKDPSASIPKGTLLATFFTFCAYIVMAIFVALTCDRYLLQNDYNFLQQINFWPPFVVIGVFATTLSAALGNLIGASRILEALAKDDVFWMLLRPATIATKGGNPYVAVIISWFLVQVVLLIGSLNAIAPITSVFFLLAYAATNVACLALELASAPNFRPTFNFFSWHSCVLGIIGSLVMCFLVNPIYASIAIMLLTVLCVVLHLRSMPTSWGHISQALIFHQVRKYLLMLDMRKDHVKFWRPQILLLVSNPRTCCELIDFVNNMKKGGLYLLGHVQLGDFDELEADPVQGELSVWLSLVDKLKIKAFVELTIAKTVREGVHHLVHLSGLGGMKPNTICLGFYDNSIPEDSIVKHKGRGQRRRIKFPLFDESGDWTFEDNFPDLRKYGESKDLSIEEYIHIVADAVKFKKNVCLCRHFHRMDKDTIMKSKNPMFIDVWPVNFFWPKRVGEYDNTSLFVLQLACILNMVSGWKSHTILRIFLCINSQNGDSIEKTKVLQDLLVKLRIKAQIKCISWEHVACLSDQSEAEADQIQDDQIRLAAGSNDNQLSVFEHTPDEYLRNVNDMIKMQTDNTAVTFMYLPLPPQSIGGYKRYHECLDMLTVDLPPTVLVHGIHPVTSTTL
ncbi:unnamed protein product [Owenia fusiformis]|uniref:Solute carrier family 12 member 9 n=1 Tax=Owenia fusiformis TaxID=6347 RepID=A0A8J1YAB4_OWEFU|nr:unnamed protein product [Owenia fusiformis]